MLWCLPAIAQPISLICAPSTPVAAPGEMIRLNAWATVPEGEKPVYAWSVSSGEVRPAGVNSFSWKFAEDSVGANSADGDVRSGGRVQARCLVEVQVVAGQTAEAGTGLLTSNGPEAAGAGLYNYLLISNPATQQLNASVVRAWMALNAPVARLRGILKPNEPIAMALPVLEKTAGEPDPEWTLQHYDFQRAHALLDKVFPGNRPGVYVVSSLQPIANSRPPYLIQNLSSTTPPLAAQWVEAFLNEAAQEHSWNAASVAELADQMRATVLVLNRNLKLPQLMKWIALL